MLEAEDDCEDSGHAVIEAKERARFALAGEEGQTRSEEVGVVVVTKPAVSGSELGSDTLDDRGRGTVCRVAELASRGAIVVVECGRGDHCTSTGGEKGRRSKKG